MLLINRRIDHSDSSLTHEGILNNLFGAYRNLERFPKDSTRIPERFCKDPWRNPSILKVSINSSQRSIADFWSIPWRCVFDLNMSKKIRDLNNIPDFLGASDVPRSFSILTFSTRTDQLKTPSRAIRAWKHAVQGPCRTVPQQSRGDWTLPVAKKVKASVA